MPLGKIGNKSLRVAVTSSSFSKNLQLREDLRLHFDHIVFNEEGKKLTRDELINFVTDADLAIVGPEQVDDVLLTASPKLKAISKYGVGLDNIDFEACRRHGVKVEFREGVNRRAVAELTLGFMISLLRNIVSSTLGLKNGSWVKNGGHNLSGQVVGIIGVGHVGKEVATLLKPFGCKILGNDIRDQAIYFKEQSIEKCTKEELLKQSDIVTIHTPLDKSTFKLIGKNELDLMKPSAFLINTARGAIVDEDELKKALLKGRIAGAALDVYLEEPSTNKELLGCPNLICTPHIGGNSQEAVLAMGRSAIEGLLVVLTNLKK